MIKYWDKINKILNNAKENTVDNIIGNMMGNTYLLFISKTLA